MDWIFELASPAACIDRSAVTIYDVGAKGNVEGKGETTHEYFYYLTKDHKIDVRRSIQIRILRDQIRYKNLSNSAREKETFNWALEIVLACRMFGTPHAITTGFKADAVIIEGTPEAQFMSIPRDAYHNVITRAVVSVEDFLDDAKSCEVHDMYADALAIAAMYRKANPGEAYIGSDVSRIELARQFSYMDMKVLTPRFLEFMDMACANMFEWATDETVCAHAVCINVNSPLGYSSVKSRVVPVPAAYTETLCAMMPDTVHYYEGLGITLVQCGIRATAKKIAKAGDSLLNIQEFIMTAEGEGGAIMKLNIEARSWWLTLIDLCNRIRLNSVGIIVTDDALREAASAYSWWSDSKLTMCTSTIESKVAPEEILYITAQATHKQAGNGVGELTEFVVDDHEAGNLKYKKFSFFI